MSSPKRKDVKDGVSNLTNYEIFMKAITPDSKWPDKDEFLDVIYWMKQILGLVIGILWGLCPLRGWFAIFLFFLINAIILFVYPSSFQKIDEEEYGGFWEVFKEGMMTSSATFLITWIILYSALHYQ